MKIEDIVKELQEREPEAILRTLAFMAYNPSIGRVLESGGVKKFEQIVVNKMQGIEVIDNEKEFDNFHKRFVKTLISKVKTNKGKKLSYGQAQKPINTFFKVYIDWASLPNRKIADRFRKFMHCPLDKIFMKSIKDKFKYEYEREVLPIYRKKHIRPSNLSLTSIDEEVYNAWQELIRSIYPEKPVLLDVFWALNR